MKKALIILLVLAVAGGLFAQNLSFSGEMRSGIGLRFQDGKDPLNNDEGYRPSIVMTGNIGDHVGRFQLRGRATTDDGVAGVDFEIRINGNADGNIELAVEHSWGFINFADNMVQLVAGRGGPGGFGTMGGVDAGFDLLGGGRNGIGVLVRPMGDNNLQIGFNIKTFGQQRAFGTVATENYWGDDPTANQLWESAFGANFNAESVSITNAWYGAGVRYEMPGLFRAVANFRTSYRTILGMPAPTNAQVRTDIRDDLSAHPNDGAWDIAVGINVLALGDLGLSTLAVDFALQNMDHKFLTKDFNGNGDWTDLQIGQRINFASGPIGASLRTRQMFLLGVDTDKDKSDGWGWEEYAPILQFAAHVQYTMGSLVPRLDAGFIMNAQPQANFRRGWDAVNTGFSMAIGAREGFNKDAMGVAIAPSIRLNMTRSFIDFGYTMSYDMSKEIDNEMKGVLPKDATRLRNMIYLDFGVTF